MRQWAAAMVISVVLASCGSVASTPSTGSPSGSITVLAAASLTAAFDRIGADFQQAHPGTAVHFSFAGSATLVAQVQEGAMADVLASADEPSMQKLVAGGLVQGSPSVFARNQLQIVVAPGNPKHITGLSDLGRSGLVIVLCAAVVPCGRYATQSLHKAGVTVKPASLEADVKAVVSKVALGEADAGIVYATDVRAAGPRVQGIDIPGGLNVIADYPIALLKDSQNVRLAKAFVAYVLEDVPQSGRPSGQQTLGQYGFLGP
jgi:molybdate transport system substrate-binding protein